METLQNEQQADIFINAAAYTAVDKAETDEQLARDASTLVSTQRTNAGHPGVREPAVPFVTEN